ncbi:MAG: hypothetical protein QHC78_15250 [Pigmentiphaga sp.]|uniref:hypothetical protein n=1 Tax=Pigmentiphaga sp. TaxID=1977564 RepID=UPI0029A5254A|nr:hypothetical protein [Pigmentiphaga sp.]MDX3907042.1 hypothetical protein [Pigmentiphaga sp.]
MHTDTTPTDPQSTVRITLLLKHHAGLVLDDVQSRLKASNWWFDFPPPGVKIVSWEVVMGFAQICILEVPAHRLAEVNVELERRAWGVFKVEVHPSYDFVPVRERIKQRVLAGGQ